jgi:hypothetical protein
MATGRDKYARQSLGGSLQARIKQVQLLICETRASVTY